jgi:hypothetical protein
MSIITITTIILNILAILVLCIGLFFRIENPKSKAVYGYAIAGGMIPYMFALSVFVAADVIIKHHLWSILLILCVISPFIIGKLVRYETLKKYTFIQILCFCVSLVVLCL